MERPGSELVRVRSGVFAWVRHHAAGLLVGLASAAAGLLEGFVRSARGDDTTSPALVLLLGVIMGSARCRPGLSLALVWTTGLLQLLVGAPLLLTQVLLLYVAFAAARWGGRWVLTASAISIPAGAAAVAAVLRLRLYEPGPVAAGVVDLTGSSAVFALLVPVSALAATWLAGLAVRFRDSAKSSRRERAEAERESASAHRQAALAYEIARLRDEQTQLAHDVHDVVGHSLAVILAQAESGQYFPDSDPGALKETLRTIAGSARSSLRDVQQVLSATPVLPGRLDALVEGAAGTGFALRTQTTGIVRPLPPELAAVAYRVLQEMITNAIKHGDRSAPLTVQQRWPEQTGDGLQIVVTNKIATSSDGGSSGGLGLEGMSRRLQGVGGRLQVDAGTTSFSLTAWVPVRS